MDFVGPRRLKSLIFKAFIRKFQLSMARLKLIDCNLTK